MTCQVCGAEYASYETDSPIAGICQTCQLLDRYGSRFGEALQKEIRSTVLLQVAQRLGIPDREIEYHLFGNGSAEILKDRIVKVRGEL